MRKWNGVKNYIPGIHWYAFSDINQKWKARINCEYGGVETETTIWVYEYKGGKYKKAKGAVYETWYPSLYNYTSGKNSFYRKEGFQKITAKRLHWSH